MAKAAKAKQAVRVLRPSPAAQARTGEVKRSSFVSSEEVEELSYDFTDHGGGVGVIPEPSDEQIRQFRVLMANWIDAATGGESPEDDERPDAEDMPIRDQLILLGKTMRADDSEQTHSIITGIAAVCSGSPSYEEIKALPYRVQQKFLGWVVGTFLSPTS